MANSDFANREPWTLLEYHITMMKMIRELSNLISLVAHEDAREKKDVKLHRETILDIADRADAIRDFANVFELPRDLCESLNYHDMRAGG